MIDFIGSISFPNISPVLVRLGPFSIKWYGMAYIAGFASAFMVLRLLIDRNVLRISREALADLMSFIAFGVIVGGRAGWWLFYHRGSGQIEPWYEPLALWHGGMSFHGGLLGVATVLAIWA